MHSRNITYVNDQWTKISYKAMGQISTHGRYVNLFVNGLFWGLYNIQERPDAAFNADYIGGKRRDWDVIKHTNNFSDGENTPHVIDGSLDSWNELYNLSSSPNLDYIAILELLNPESLCDYVLLNFYNGTVDWMPNNWYASYNRSIDSKFRFYIWDAEKAFNTDNLTNLSPKNTPIRIFHNLMRNSNFRTLFADRFYKALFNNGALTSHMAQLRFKNLSSIISYAINGEFARWGDVQKDFRVRIYDQPWDKANLPYTKIKDWSPEIIKVHEFFEYRRNNLENILIDSNMLPDISPPIFNLQDSLKNKIMIFESHPSNIYYTLDGSDPRLFNGLISPKAIKHYQDNPKIITDSHYIRARKYENSVWSAINEFYIDINSIYSINKLKFTQYDNQLRLTFMSDMNTKYVLQYSDNLKNWLNMTTFYFDGRNVEFIIPNSYQNDNKTFFRVSIK